MPSRAGRTEASRSDHQCSPRDSVDELLGSWAQRRPELDFSPVAVAARLSRVRSHLDATLEQVYEAHGLTAANFAVLVTLARIQERRGVSQRRLMDELGLTSGTISVRMDRLVEAGLIERRPDPDSGRNTLITLTNRGREVFERVVPAHLTTERRALAALSAEEEALLAALLRKLLVEFEGSLPPADAPLRLGLVLAPAHETISLRASVGLMPVSALLVRRVEQDAPAALAGIVKGDVLRRAGRRELRSVSALYAAIDDAAASGRLTVELIRGSGRHTATIQLGPAAPIVGALAATSGRTPRGEHVI